MRIGEYSKFGVSYRETYENCFAAEFEFMRIRNADDTFRVDEDGKYLCVGLEFGDGWLELVYDMCCDLRTLYKDTPFTILQVKEKFGLLRVYADTYIESVEKIFEEYEQLSKTICMNCGVASTPENPVYYEKKSGWIGYMCKGCWDERTNWRGNR